MLFDKLKEYSNSGVYPFHMPGHKRVPLNDALPYELDLTEIEGFDNLHNAKGCIRELQYRAATLFHAEHAFALINGATGGILAAVRAMTKIGDRVIVARNCHKSVYHAVELCALKPEYYMPESLFEGSEPDILGCVNQFELDIMLSEHSDVKLVVLTSPTYEGVVSDISRISEICRRHGARLLVDEAHGAHFPFSGSFPKSAVDCGADAAVVSLHKTLPSLTQTALLLTNDNELAVKLEENLAVFETSSPSYVLLSSIECCLNYLDSSADDFDKYTKRLYRFSQRMDKLSHLKLLFRDENEQISNLFDYDLGKLVVSTAHTNLSGIELAAILRNRYKIEIEMAAADYIVAMTSPLDTDEGFDRLSDALFEIDRECEPSSEFSVSRNFQSLPQRRFYAAERCNYRSRLVSLQDAEGMVSTEYIMAYPPGIPLIVPGEVISMETLTAIKHLILSGVEVESSQKNLPDFISAAEI